ncbi:MAG: hypothetical protein RLZ97_551 [Verrucomicrobiota bacterium]
MSWHTLGDSAWLATFPGGDAGLRLRSALDLARLLREAGLPGVADVVNGYDTVAVWCDPADLLHVGDDLLRLSGEMPARAWSSSRLFEIPVHYGGEDGPDLIEVAETLGLSPADVIALHQGADFEVATIGFSPGFPYLAGLPEALVLPRRSTPRRVRAGSVAIAGNQAGIYPNDSPAGWHVIGRTSLRLFDAMADEPSTLQAGDRVRFVPATGPCAGPESRASKPDETSPIACTVIDAGSRTTIQDGGRPGFRSVGVTRGGAVDPVSLAVANLLVGNPVSAAALECCVSGPRLRFQRAARVAWVGWLGGGRAMDVQAGEELDLRRGLAGVTGYLAIAGGIEVDPCMGSAATDLRGGFGGLAGRALWTGDRLSLGNPSALAPRLGNWCVDWPRRPRRDAVLEIRCLAGYQGLRFPNDARRTFHESLFPLGADSDRMGLRFHGPRVCPPPGFEMVSQPVVAGTVQIPPDGRPTVLMAEAQTLGGYPQIAHVISADLPLLARAWPGTRVRFRLVELAEAIDAWTALRDELGVLRAGLQCLGSEPCC